MLLKIYYDKNMSNDFKVWKTPIILMNISFFCISIFIILKIRNKTMNMTKKKQFAAKEWKKKF